MSTRVRQQDGDLLIPLSDEQRAQYDGPRGCQPAVGADATLWRLRGTWHIWSPGPTVGTWWLKPVDVHAQAVVEQLRIKPDRALPVVTALAGGCIAVRSKDIRSGGR